MMKRLLFYFSLLFIAVYFGSKFAGNPGYVLFAYKNWSAEVSLWFATLFILLLILVFYIFSKTFGSIRSIVQNWRIWILRRKTVKAWSLMQQGFSALIEAKWGKAQQQLERAAMQSDRPFILFLAAAKAAQAQGKLKERDAYLEKALHSTEGNPLVIGLSQAEWEVQDKQFVQALLILKTLAPLAPRHPQILNLLHIVYMELQDWYSLKELLPQLCKAKFFTQEKFSALELTVYRALLLQTFCMDAVEKVSGLWKDMPKHLQNNSSLLSDYCGYLIKKQRYNEAEDLLQRALKKQWDPRLIQHYGHIQSHKPIKQLALAKAWLKNHGKDPDLLLCLGRLNARYSLWGQARDYLQASIHAGGGIDAYYELAKVLEKLGEQAAAFDCYKKLASQLL
jgi:HemY protein